MSAYTYTTADLAAEFGLAEKTIRKRAARLGLGINLDGRAGYRYSDADRTKLIEDMRPEPVVAKRRRRRAA
jgi:hypothetical protein